MEKERTAVVLSGIDIVNVVVIAKGEEGDKFLAEHSEVVEITDLEFKPGVGWTYIDGSFFPPELPNPTREEVREMRRYNYQIFTDPLFFLWQRGEATKEEWLESIAKVKEEIQFFEGPDTMTSFQDEVEAVPPGGEEIAS